MGPSSYPRNGGFFTGVVWDYLVLLCLLIQRYLMQLEGKWTYVFLSKNELYVPQFRDPVDQYKKYRSLPEEEQLNHSFSLDGITDASIQSIHKEEADAAAAEAEAENEQNH